MPHQFDIESLLAALRRELYDIDQAILAFEQMAASGPRTANRGATPPATKQKSNHRLRSGFDAEPVQPVQSDIPAKK